MDDNTLTIPTHTQARWVLSALEDTVSYKHMKFRPKKDDLCWKSGSRNDLATTADPLTGRYYYTGSKQPAKIGDNPNAIGPNRRAQRTEYICMYSYRHKKECHIDM